MSARPPYAATERAGRNRHPSSPVQPRSNNNHQDNATIHTTVRGCHSECEPRVDLVTIEPTAHRAKTPNQRNQLIQLRIASHESAAVDCCGLWGWTLQRLSVHPQHIPHGLGMCYRHRERCSSCQRLPLQKEARSRRFYWSNASGIEPANSPSSAVLNLARNSTPGSKPNSNPSDLPARTRRRSI